MYTIIVAKVIFDREWSLDSKEPLISKQTSVFLQNVISILQIREISHKTS
jgi:hypothetical protein